MAAAVGTLLLLLLLAAAPAGLAAARADLPVDLEEARWRGEASRRRRVDRPFEHVAPPACPASSRPVAAPIDSVTLPGRCCRAPLSTAACCRAGSGGATTPRRTPRPSAPARATGVSTQVRGSGRKAAGGPDRERWAASRPPAAAPAAAPALHGRPANHSPRCFRRADEGSGCKRFYRCERVGSYSFRCPSHTLWDQVRCPAPAAGRCGRGTCPQAPPRPAACPGQAR